MTYKESKVLNKIWKEKCKISTIDIECSEALETMWGHTTMCVNIDWLLNNAGAHNFNDHEEEKENMHNKLLETLHMPSYNFSIFFSQITREYKCLSCEFLTVLDIWLKVMCSLNSDILSK